MPKTKLNLGTQYETANEPTETSGRYNRDLSVRNCLTDSIRKCKKSRDQIAEEMSELIGRLVTIRHLDEWTAESKSQYRFPASHVLAFCHATGDTSLSRLLLPPREKALLQIAEEFIKRDASDRKIELLKDVLASGGKIQ